MCMYCENSKTEEEHFVCDVCGEGMCEDCYELDTEHTLHYNRILEVCDNDIDYNLIVKSCNGEPEYLCEKCLNKIFENRGRV